VKKNKVDMILLSFVFHFLSCEDNNTAVVLFVFFFLHVMLGAVWTSLAYSRFYFWTAL